MMFFKHHVYWSNKFGNTHYQHKNQFYYSCTVKRCIDFRIFIYWCEIISHGNYVFRGR